MAADQLKAPATQERRRWLDRPWAIGVQVALAALMFMAITQLSQVIVTRGLALLGMRTDVATIIGIEACGRTIPTAPASVFNASDDRMRVEICKGRPADRASAQVLTAAPSGQPVSLIVNGSRMSTRQSAAARVTFDEVMLHPGDNKLSVAVGDRAASDLQFEEVTPSYSRTQFGLLRDLPVGAPIIASLPQAGPATRIVGGGAGPEKSFVLLSGTPESLAEAEGLESAWIGPSGFAVAQAKQVPANVPALTPDLFRRSARITRLPSGELVLSAEACLPEDSALAQWARSGTLSANDFFARLTEIRIDPAQLGPAERSGQLATWDAPKCRMIRSRSKAPVAAIMRFHGNLLSTPFDSMQFQDFGDRLIFSRPPPSTEAPDLVTFSGQWAGQADETLEVEPDYSIFASEVNAAAQVPAPPAGPIASRLAQSWTKAENGLPSWLRALLSGVAAVAPVLVLLLVIRRLAPAQQTIAAERTEVLAGLNVLLLLALGAAAQPLFFQLFFRAANWLQVWVLLAETRGDNRWVYPDPYAPVALAIAFMLIPFLKTLRYDEDLRQSAPISFFCFIFSLAAVVVLFALALAQRLPWQGGERVWLIQSLQEHGLVLTAQMTLPLIIAALIVAVGTAWIPLFWGFRTLAPRRGFLGASLMAGSAAILLPLVSYALEAGRLLVMPEAGRFSSDPSFLALLGGSVLPFILFLTLLLAFREVVMIAVPETRETRALEILRTRNLACAAALLTLPRLAMGQAAVAPSDMGIIDILSIFQSFGLVAAVLLAISMLEAYSPFAPKGGAVAEPLKPFAFSSGELDIIAALFVGYLAMWTSGFLATAVAIAIGWPLFKKLVVEPELALPGELATPELARSLVEFRRNLALFEARGKQLEAHYTSAESDFAALTAERNAIDAERKALEKKLGMNANEAKRRLLEFGPGSTPFANGVIGAIAGLGFALVLQLATSIYGADTNGPLTSWADLARRALEDPVYSIAPTGSQSAATALADVARVATPDLLLFVGALINACFPWVLLGFIFGFAFHRIRGDDGVIKGLVLAVAIAIAYAFSQLFAAGSDGIRMTRVIPVFLFLLLVGVAVFDVKSLARRKLSPTQLGDVYGFRTSVGYASLIGAIAAVEPVFRFISGFFSKG